MTSRDATTPFRHGPEQQPVRPTEAQLRWAQFHRKSRVASVKETVERLWQTPATVSDVEGAFPDDGITTDESSAGDVASPRPEQQRRRRREKPKISRGRRALLRVSKRAYEQRQTYIHAHGYQCCGEDSDDKENCDVEDEEAEAAVLAMLSEEPRKKHRRRRKKRRSHGLQQVEDEERLRRFEAAYQVIFASLAGPQQHPLEHTPSKRWTRGTHVPVAVSIDGRQYDDLKWGFTGKKESVHRVIASPINAPADRRASWLVHLPSRPQSERRHSTPAELALGETDIPLSLETAVPSRVPTSPGKAKFDELMARLQNKPASNAVPPLVESSLQQDMERTALTGTVLFPTSGVNRLPQSKRDPFLEKQPHDSQEEFERRRIAPRVPSGKRDLPSFLQKSRNDSTLQEGSIVKRNVKRLSPSKRDGFFRALQAPYMSAAAASPVRRRSKSRKTVRRGKRLSMEMHDPFLEKKQSNGPSRRTTARKNMPKLSREKRGAFLKVSPDESGEDLESSFRTVGTKVGGLLNMFSSSNKGTGEEEEPQAVVAIRKLGSTMFSGGKTASAEEVVGNPMASLRDFFSGGKKVNQDEVTASSLAMTDEAAVQAFRKLAAGQEMTELENVRAAVAHRKMVSRKKMTIDQETAYRKLVVGEELSSEEEDHAAIAYRKVVAGRQLSSTEEAAYRRLVAGENLTKEEERESVEAYRKLVSSEEDVEGDEDVEDFFGSLRKLASGQEMTNEEEIQALDAWHKMIAGKLMTIEEESAFRNLIHGDALNAEEEDEAAAAYRKVVSLKQLTGQEEVAYRKLLSGEDLRKEEEQPALEAFRKVIPSNEVMDEESEEDEEDFFGALRKLAAGQEMTAREEEKAQSAFQRMVFGKLMTIEEESAYLNLVSGVDLTAEEEDLAVLAYSKLVSGRNLSDEEETAYGRLISGEALTHEEEVQAREAYLKLISVEVAGEADIEDLFRALRKLAAGDEMTDAEEVRAADAYQKMVSCKQMTPEEDAAYRKLVAGVELTDKEEDQAVVAYRKLVFGKQLTDEEESAYGRFVAGEDLTEEEEHQAVEAYRKLVADEVTKEEDIQEVFALQKLVADQEMTETEDIRAAIAYQKLVYCKRLTNEEEKAYRKLVSGEELTVEEEDEAVTAYRKLVGGKKVTQDEENAFRKLVNGEELTNTDEYQAVQAYRKMVSLQEVTDEEAVAAYKKLMSSGFATDEEELQAVAAFRKMQDERNDAKDDTTSVSSFRLLPDGFQRVVQDLSGQEHADEIDSQAQSEYTQQSSRYPVAHSPDRSATGRTGVDVLSPEQMKIFHQQVLENSALIGEREADQTIIDTDDTTSDASGVKFNPTMAAGLLLSPTILTKRHHQAIRAVERRNWEQASYLLSANPWLAEMTDLTTRQYLLHKVALYGAGNEAGEVRHVAVPAAPEQLNMDILRMFPSAVHKFDQDGNLPLHMSAASGNLAMIKLLSERFPSGASVRNNDGFLPLHLAILSLSPQAADSKQTTNAIEAVEIILKLFPGAVAVADNEGNLPLHTAAGALQGDVGVDAIYLLLDEAERQANSTSGVRFSDIKTKDDDDSASVNTAETATPTDLETADGDIVHCTMVRNSHGHNSLVKAIRSKAGWEMVEAIVGGPGGVQAALRPDASMNNALHLLVSGEFADPASILSILKVAPQAATIRNGEGMLPIEVACMQALPREVILALVLVDLPVDLDAKDGVKILDGFGSSWWFVTCECEDLQVDIVSEVISICSYAQIRELCFMQGGPNRSGGSVLSRATPKCRLELRKALRFVGRFEFLGSAALHTDSSLGLKVFEALDFGTEEEPLEEGRRTLLYCYGSEDAYMEETALLRQHVFDSTYVEEAFDFAVHELDNQSARGAPRQFCIAIERPILTLDRVVAGISKNEDYHRDSDTRTRFLTKNCGKFDDRWKLAGLMEMHNRGDSFDPSRMGDCSPPESFERNASFRSQVVADPSIDIWAFGKLAYEVLVGEPLIDLDSDRTLFSLAQWNEANLREVVKNLERAGISSTGADLIAHCLVPNPEDRPSNMDDILDHPFWKDMRRKGTSKSRSKHQRGHLTDN